MRTDAGIYRSRKSTDCRGRVQIKERQLAQSRKASNRPPRVKYCKSVGVLTDPDGLGEIADRERERERERARSKKEYDRIKPKTACLLRKEVHPGLLRMSYIRSRRLSGRYFIMCTLSRW